MDGTQEPGEQLLHYHGWSMWPLLKEGDLVCYWPVDPRDVRVGDCVIIGARGSRQAAVVHRVCARLPTIRTKGDHNPREDEEAVDPAFIEGRVVARIRGGRRRPVRGGRRGTAIARMLQLATLFDPQREARLGRLARAFRLCVRPLMRWRLRGSRASSFVGANGQSERLLILAGHTIASYDRGQTRWNVDWPYRMWVDPDELQNRFPLFSAERRCGTEGQ